MTVFTRDFRLTKTVRPVSYDLRFDLDLEQWTSIGWARVLVEIDEPAREIVLHAVELDITSAEILSGPTFERVSYDEESQTATLRFAGPITPGTRTLELSWNGVIRDGLRGLYRATYADRRYAATQFEATAARRAFPCWDEPEFKATYRISIAHDPKLTALSNGAVERTEPLADGRVLTRFKEVPKISSYLVAFTVGPYEATETRLSETGVPVRVWLPPGLADKGDYARDAHARAIAWLEEYTGIPYPYGKIDGIGVPDFEAGAMENPGAVTYRTNLLAADPATATTAAFKRIFSVVAHELTHMWWGDLVTMAWWDDLWLNESFASFVGEKCTNALNPEWRYVRDIVAGSIGAYALDQLASTHPIRMEVRNADQATERFDAVTYEKGQAVLRMIESFIGEGPFRDGVGLYLERFAEANATADDFWQALDEASGRDVTAIANAWIREPGHPIIDCSLQVATGGLTVGLSQQRFFLDPAAAPTGQRWLVPMVFKYGTPAGVREERFVLSEARGTVTLPGADWYYPNAGARGFYRYALDDESLRRLAGAVHQLGPEERLMLVNNQWTLTRAGRAHLGQLFALIAGLKGEQDRAVLDAIAEPIGWLWLHAVRDEDRPAFQRFVRDLFRPLLDSFGWEPRPDEDAEARELRARAVGLVGRIGGDEQVQAEARRYIDEYLDGGRQIDPDLLSALVGVAAVRGDQALYDRYLARREQAATTDAQEEQRFRGALAAFEGPALVDRTLHETFDGFIRTQDRGSMLMSLLGSRHGRDAAWQQVRRRWDEKIAPLDPAMRHWAVSAVGQLTPPDLAPAAADFLRTKQAPDTVEVTAQTLERLRLAAEAAQRLAGELPEALQRAT